MKGKGWHLKINLCQVATRSAYSSVRGLEAEPKLYDES